MVKVRLQGMEEEVQEVIKTIEEGNELEILEKSNSYRNRNSQYVRVYLDIEKRNKVIKCLK